MTPEEIKALRQKLGITQRELAERIGVSTKAVKNWEQGLRECKGAARTAALKLNNKKALAEAEAVLKLREG